MSDMSILVCGLCDYRDSFKPGYNLNWTEYCPRCQHLMAWWPQDSLIEDGLVVLVDEVEL